ncbi:unnamed protein product [Prorocentrum cordatum]|uniref:RNA helicase n=1 Tax=Prorocentrum cordatum TaxID=2364126 RepID=A0ABN9VJQ5_9DINO|nr:unnamed protein product [Polarella glacialis]
MDRGSWSGGAGLGLVGPCSRLARELMATVADKGAQASELAAAACAHHAEVPQPPWATDGSRKGRAGNSRLAAQLRSPRLRPLSPAQSRAVGAVASQMQQLTLVQGPPGTGKTEVAVEVARAWLRARRGPILAAAAPHSGVGVLVDSLQALGASVLRLGAVDPEVPCSLDAHLRSAGPEPEGGASRGERLMRGVHVVCATCVGAGTTVPGSPSFPFVVVDGAAQATEPATLVALARGAVQAVLVGDPGQLRPTLASEEARAGGLGVSLFERLVDLGVRPHALSVQFRMHPAIMAFPSRAFYGGVLRASLLLAEGPPPIATPDDLGHLAFVHVGSAQEEGEDRGEAGDEEAKCIRHVMEGLQCMPGDAGIIAASGGQVAAVHLALRGLSGASEVLVGTVSAFQGVEKEAIILSASVGPSGEPWPEASCRHLPVALTRARRLLVVVGDLQRLCSSGAWSFLVAAGSCARALEWQGGALGPLSPGVAAVVAAARERSAASEGVGEGAAGATAAAGAEAAETRAAGAQEHAGYLFHCRGEALSECEAAGVLAAPEGSLGSMRQAIRAKTKLFLLDCDRGTVIGPFAPTSRPGLDLARGAFGGQLRAQVRVRAPAELLIARPAVRPAPGPQAAAEVRALLRELSSGEFVDARAFEAWQASSQHAPRPLAPAPAREAPAAGPAGQAEDGARAEAPACGQHAEPPSAPPRDAPERTPEGPRGEVVCVDRPEGEVASAAGVTGTPAPPPVAQGRPAAHCEAPCADLAGDWGACLLAVSLVRCRKRKAAEEEDYAVAHAAKGAEAEAVATLSSRRRRALNAGRREEEWRDVQRRKQAAVAQEDFRLAGQLRKRQLELEEEGDPDEELREVAQRKKEAAAAEDFDRAAELRKHEDR